MIQATWDDVKTLSVCYCEGVVTLLSMFADSADVSEKNQKHIALFDNCDNHGRYLQTALKTKSGFFCGSMN